MPRHYCKGSQRTKRLFLTWTVAIAVAFGLLMSVVAISAVSSPSARAQAPLLYGAAHDGPDGPSTLYTLDTTTGAATEVGPVGFERCSGMDFDAAGTLYATCERLSNGEPPVPDAPTILGENGDDVHVLITIDPATGAGTEVGPTNVVDLDFGDTMSDISFRNSDGALYAYLEAGDGVGTIDKSTGLASALGPSNTNSCCGNGIAFSPDDTLYHATDDPLNTLDQTTGAATFVADLVYPPPADADPRINALDYQPGTGILFASLNDRQEKNGRENYLATVDTGTGDVTIIGQTVDGLDAIAFGPEAEEPTPTATAEAEATATVSADIIAPDTGTGGSTGGGTPAWLIAALAGTSLAGAAGYAALRLRVRRS